MQQFTPRKPRSNWSVPNVRRVEKLIQQRKMTKKGLELYSYAKAHDMLPDPVAEPDRTVPGLPPAFSKALDKDPLARRGFQSLSDSRKRYYLLWIITAKKEETRLRRINEAVALLREGRELGMK
jgi:uncharacterized protein YdeI (YjbR/CyaY-like superfamily)